MNYKRPTYMYMSFQRCAWMMIIFATDIYEELDWLPSYINVSYNCFNDLMHIIYEQFEKQNAEKTKSNILARIMPPKQGCASYIKPIVFCSSDRAHATIVWQTVKRYIKL